MARSEIERLRNELEDWRLGLLRANPHVCGEHDKALPAGDVKDVLNFARHYLTVAVKTLDKGFEASKLGGKSPEHYAYFIQTAHYYATQAAYRLSDVRAARNCPKPFFGERDDLTVAECQEKGQCGCDEPDLPDGYDRVPHEREAKAMADDLDMVAADKVVGHTDNWPDAD